MSELWICREQTAKHPFLAETPEMELWNIEELCFYLYQNMERIDETTINETLFTWLEKELMLPRLAASLAQEQKRGRGVLWCAWFLLQEMGMYSDAELEEVRTYCLAMENKDAFECQKLKADRLLMNGRYMRSIREYQRLLSIGESKSQYQHLLGDIWHNLGVAHTRLFLFQEAAEYFKEAYKRNRCEESLWAQQEALSMMKQEKTGTLVTEGMDWEQCLTELKKDYKKKVM